VWGKEKYLSMLLVGVVRQLALVAALVGVSWAATLLERQEVFPLQVQCLVLILTMVLQAMVVTKAYLVVQATETANVFAWLQSLELVKCQSLGLVEWEPLGLVEWQPLGLVEWRPLGLVVLQSSCCA
jgi:hypothetical protein